MRERLRSPYRAAPAFTHGDPLLYDDSADQPIDATRRSLLRSLLPVLDDLSLVCGVGAVLLAARALTLPIGSPGLAVLTALTIVVRFVPLGRYSAGLTLLAATPTLAIMALYGPAWAIATATAAAALTQAVPPQWSTTLEERLRHIARTATGVGLGAVAFTAMGAAPGTMTLALTLPALSATQVVFAVVSWLLSLSTLPSQPSPDSVKPITEMASGLPIIAAEPLLALVLASAAAQPEPTTLLATLLPLGSLVIALQVHGEMRRRLEGTHTALQRAYDHMRVQATTDPLTGLGNRRFFDDALAARLDEARRHGRPLAVLLIDLDGFKKINDTYGHAAGDALLIAVAGAMRSTLRRSDTPARLGGDEFVALLPETSGANALALGQRLCLAIAAIALPVGGETVHPSASVGAASTDAHYEVEAAALLAAADGAAYAAKAAGKSAARLADGTRRSLPPVRRRPRL